MKLLINDYVQTSDAPDELKSPALADDYEFTTSIDIDLGSSKEINCVGIGNTDGVNFTIDGEAVTFSDNGLYLLPNNVTDQIITVGFDGSFLGRIALGVYTEICTSPAKEPGFFTTQQKRITASGQEIPGAGGIFGKKQGVDSRYKITEDIINDFESAYTNQNGQLYPFFINFADEFKIGYDYFYAALNESDISFQGAINKFLYSKRFDFIERF